MWRSPLQNPVKKLCGLLLCCLALSACFPGVYKLDIPQGNILEKEKVDQLKVGMSKRQVRYLLGTPLVIDSFNQDRWEYYYSITYYRPRSSEPHYYQSRVVLQFEKGQLSHIDRQLPDEAHAAPATAPAVEEKALDTEPESLNP